MGIELQEDKPRAKSALILAGTALSVSILGLTSSRFDILAAAIALVMFCILAERLTRGLYHQLHIEGIGAALSRLLVLALALTMGVIVSIGVYDGAASGAEEMWFGATMLTFMAGSAILGAVTPLSEETGTAVTGALLRAGFVTPRDPVDAGTEREAPLWLARWLLGLALALYGAILAVAFAVAQQVQILFLAVTGLFLLGTFIGRGRRWSALADAVVLHGRLGSLPSTGFSQALTTFRLDLLVEVVVASFWVAMVSFGVLGTLTVRPWPDGLQIVCVAGPFAFAELHLLGMLLRGLPSLLKEEGEAAQEGVRVGVAYLGFFTLGAAGVFIIWPAKLADSAWVAPVAVAAIAMAGVGYWVAHILWRGGPAYQRLSGRLPWHLVFASGLWMLPAVGHETRGLPGAVGGLFADMAVVLLAGYPRAGKAVARVQAHPPSHLFGSKSVRFLIGWLPLIVLCLVVVLGMVMAGWRWAGLTVMALFLLWFLAFPLRYHVEAIRGGSNKKAV